jgi:uncharacterized membrane protein YfcA
LPVIEYLPAALAVVFVFLAAIVRGYSGFGFSLLAITALSLIYEPARVIPSIFLLEIAASLHLLPGLWRDIHWRSVALLLVGTTLGTPLGVYVLAHVPAAPMKVALAGFVIVAAILLWRGFALATMPNRTATLAIGATAGAANGAFGIGGPPVILFYFASPAGHAVSRASLVVYFLLTDIIGLGFLGRQGLVGYGNLILASILLPTLLAGVWFGARRFKTADPARFRRWVLIILGVLALITAGQGVVAMVQTKSPVPCDTGLESCAKT